MASSVSADAFYSKDDEQSVIRSLPDEDLCDLLHKYPVAELFHASVLEEVCVMTAVAEVCR